MLNSMPQAQTATQTDQTGKEYLVLSLGGQEYGIDILKVREIRRFEQKSLTRLANVPDFILGVTNLRGLIVPIVDLRMKLNLDEAAYGEHTAVVILNLDEQVVGVVVDGVSDVLILRAEHISEPPGFDDVFASEFLTGIGTVDERMLILVDIQKLMHSAEMDLLEEKNSTPV